MILICFGLAVERELEVAPCIKAQCCFGLQLEGAHVTIRQQPIVNDVRRSKPRDCPRPSLIHIVRS